MFCSDLTEVISPQKHDNPGRLLIGWQPIQQGGPRPTARVSNHTGINLSAWKCIKETLALLSVCTSHAILVAFPTSDEK